ncbi:hypothetical protein ACQ4LE_007525 [Meloidogyne hapla]|uniref:Uncharacterized protein n=1 Tax=Meloidogyne hapla TaxID=6305 RepID=A0A1I8C219_MELHA
MLLLAILLLICTIILIIFFISHCALLPKRTNPHPELIPYSVVKSPRKYSAFTDHEYSNSPSPSDVRSMQSLEYLHKKLEERCRPRSHSMEDSRPRSDYLHPKYSLPPGKCGPDWEIFLNESGILRAPLQFHNKELDRNG